MFLYDPDHNYLYKFSHGREFASLVEFGDDWGSGKDTKLNVFYRMCDQLVESIKQDSSFMEFNQTRYTRGLAAPEDMHPDLKKHILAFDIIYCTNTYGLGDEIDPPIGTPEQRKTALELFDIWKGAQENVNYLNEAKAYVISIYKPSITIHHVTYGDGVIQKNTATQIEVSFNEAGTKKIGTIKATILDRVCKLEKKRQKGAGQLLKSIDNFFNHRALDDMGIDISGIKEVFPIVVTTDTSFNALGVNALVKQEFAKLKTNSGLSLPVRVLSPVILDFDTLFNLIIPLREQRFNLGNLLYQYINKCSKPGFSTMPFCGFIKDYNRPPLLKKGNTHVIFADLLSIIHKDKI